MDVLVAILLLKPVSKSGTVAGVNTPKMPPAQYVLILLENGLPLPKDNPDLLLRDIEAHQKLPGLHPEERQLLQQAHGMATAMKARN